MERTEEIRPYDVVVVGAGAAGMMAAGTAARAGRRVLLIEKMEKSGRKVRITGKGRCNVTNARPAEEFAAQERERFDIAVSRAVAPLNVLCELTLPLVKVGGRFIAMKSTSSDQEIQEARSAVSQLGGRIAAVRDYNVPQTDVRHRAVIIEKVKATPRQFPRSFARIKKSPLR